MWRSAFMCGLALALAQSAFAGPIQRNALDTDNMAWFYNRPGVTPDQLARDTSECEIFSRAMMGDAEGRAFASHGLVGAVLVAANQDAPLRAATDDCMIARQYRRFTTVDRNYAAFVARYNAMSEDVRLALASSETPPEGTLARQWGNDFWSVDETRDVPRPPIVMRPRSLDRDIPIEQLHQVDLARPISLAPDQALLIFSIQPTPAGESHGGALRFTRDDRYSGMPALVSTDPNGGRRRWPTIQTVHRARDGAATEFAYVVPAGFYSFAGAWTIGGFMVDFCMGTVAFDVAPGAVLHLGNYVMARGNQRIASLYGAPGVGVRIDPVDLDAARARLAASPELAARLAQVSYQNGFVRACTMPIMSSYGFDMPGAPWMEANADDAGK
jgi:hypothetical protein